MIEPRSGTPERAAIGASSNPERAAEGADFAPDRWCLFEPYGAGFGRALSSSSVRSSARTVLGSPCPGTTIAASG
jgi:hypothetical protein